MWVKVAETLKRANVCGPMVFGDGFRVCEADAEMATNAIGGKDVVRGRNRTDVVEAGDKGLSGSGTYGH